MAEMTSDQGPMSNLEVPSEQAGRLVIGHWALGIGHCAHPKLFLSAFSGGGHSMGKPW
jgi:hypothetical protein